MKVNKKIISRLIKFSKNLDLEKKENIERVKGFTSNDYNLFIAYQNIKTVSNKAFCNINSN